MIGGQIAKQENIYLQVQSNCNIFKSIHLKNAYQIALGLWVLALATNEAFLSRNQSFCPETDELCVGLKHPMMGCVGFEHQPFE